MDGLKDEGMLGSFPPCGRVHWRIKNQAGPWVQNYFARKCPEIF